MHQIIVRVIDKYYSGKLKSYQTVKIGNTPEYLQKLGAKPIPIVIKQSTLSKCIREPRGSRSAHGLERKMIESLPDQIRKPILVVEEKQRNSFALISDYKDKDGNNMLVAIKMNVAVQNITVNEVTSFYGRGNLETYIVKHHASEIHIIDNKKAKELASLLRLQLPTTLQALDYNHKISQEKSNVNPEEYVVGSESKSEISIIPIEKKVSVLDKLVEHKEILKKEEANQGNNVERQRQEQER